MAAELRCVDLFCGAGGFSLGFENAGFEILAASDYHETACKTYYENLGHPCLEIDVARLAEDVQPLLDTGGFAPGDIDVVVGGPPCKGFSTAGIFNTDDPRTSLLNKYIDVLAKIRPRAIVIENVTGVKKIDGGDYVSAVLETTRDLGYNTRLLELNAAEYGVPQLRERVFFIGYREKLPVSRPPQTHAGDTGQQRLGSIDIEQEYVTTREAIDDLAFLPPGETATEYNCSPSSHYQEQMRDGHNGPLYNHTAPNHGEVVRERYNALGPGETIDSLPPRLQTSKHTMMKFHPDRPANTVTTLPEDFVHYEQPRIPTVRELARLQSFPDWYEFLGPRTTGGHRRRDALPQYSQVGNAVPPILAEAVANQIKSTLINSKDAE